jgi:hypothetical protein
VCSAPEATKELKDKLEARQNQNPTDGSSKDVLRVDAELVLDGVNASLLRQTLEFVRDPVFFNFTEDHRTKLYHAGDRSIVIMV